MPDLLTATDLHFAYGDHAVLRRVSLAIRSGEIVALIGPNGSGKSTLIQSLLGHLPATGSMQVDGKSLARWPRRLLARRIAYLAQAPHFEPGQTVLDVLRMGRAPYWAAFGIESTEDLTVLQEVSHQLTLDDLLNRRMNSLSGGQRQRVFVGRCLMQQPAVLLLDEPDTYLDLRHQIELGRLIRTLAIEKQMGVLWASHDLNHAATFADRLILLHEGSVAATGSPREVLRAEVLTRTYGVNLEIISRDNRPPVVIPAPR
jgi:iron complex transport system ATP-binding protein